MRVILNLKALVRQADVCFGDLYDITDDRNFRLHESLGDIEGAISEMDKAIDKYESSLIAVEDGN